MRQSTKKKPAVATKAQRPASRPTSSPATRPGNSPALLSPQQVDHVEQIMRATAALIAFPLGGKPQARAALQAETATHKLWLFIQPPDRAPAQISILEGTQEELMPHYAMLLSFWMGLFMNGMLLGSVSIFLAKTTWDPSKPWNPVPGTGEPA